MSIKNPPCKIGDRIKATVVRPYNGHNAFIHGEVVNIDQSREVVKVVYDRCRSIEFYYEDFGKTVFVERSVIEKRASILINYSCDNCCITCEKDKKKCITRELRRRAVDRAKYQARKNKKR